MFAAWTADHWAALGVWVTAAIYVVLAVYAVRQVREARTLREQQIRPFVVVDFAVDWLTELVVENIGSAMAYDVRITFDPPLESTMERPWEWEDSDAFRRGIPTMPPGKRLVVFFDSIISRFESDLPLAYTATVSYRGVGKQVYSEEQILDLGVYRGATPPPKGLPELINSVNKVHQELAKWTDGIRGVRVHTVDRQRQERQRTRRRRVRVARRVFEQQGIRALIKHLAGNALRRAGWRS